MNSFEENAGRIARSMAAVARASANRSPFLLGEVLEPKPTDMSKPLRVRAAGLDLRADALRINESLRGNLTEGDTVAILTDDLQTYYLICKVVSP
ncbi:MAG TPA: hypothetical protein H9764_01710 [Candidatus Flavonifractor merdavium]|nr:hypothetical protein [Candidatus Flavonifractor merdavium]